MRLNQVTVSSTDVSAAIAFYQGLGLRLLVHSGDRYARLLCPDGEATLSVHLAAVPPGPGGTILYFECDDLDGTVADLRRRGYAFASEPTDQPWLWREAYLNDPDGNQVCLYHAGKNRIDPPWRLAESQQGPVRLRSLDHLVLTVRSIAATVAFYEQALGMEAQRFGPNQERVALHFGDQKINLHHADHVIDPHVRHATPGSADLCFLTILPLEEVIAQLGRQGVPIIAGPVERTGARGPIRSIYIYDPDENLIEVANQL